MNEVLPKTTTTRGKRVLEQANDPYGYNSRGNLMYQNYSFSKASSNGMANIIYWRCTEYRKQKCRSTLKTMGKQLYIIDAKHNHVPKKYGHIMSATLPIFNVSGRVSCMSFFLSLITDYWKQSFAFTYSVFRRTAAKWRAYLQIKMLLNKHKIQIKRVSNVCVIDFQCFVVDKADCCLFFHRSVALCKSK